MVVPRGTASRLDEQNALLELEAALSACLHPPPSTEPPTLRQPTPMGGVRPRDTVTGAVLVFPRQPPVLVAEEPPRAFGRTLLMAPARPLTTPPPLPVPMATTLTLSGPPPWELPPLLPAMLATPAVPVVPLALPKPRSRAKWLVMLVVLLAVSGVLAVHPPLRARTRTVLVAAGKRIAKMAVTTKDHARRALHR